MSKQIIEDDICNHFIFALRTDGFCEAVSYLVVMSLAQHHFGHSESSNLLLVEKLAMNLSYVPETANFEQCRKYFS